MFVVKNVIDVSSEKLRIASPENELKISVCIPKFLHICSSKKYRVYISIVYREILIIILALKNSHCLLCCM